MSALSRPRAAVLQFPGVNCEYESARALEAAGAEATIVRWNTAPARLAEFDLFLLEPHFTVPLCPLFLEFSLKLPVLSFPFTHSLSE